MFKRRKKKNKQNVEEVEKVVKVEEEIDEEETTEEVVEEEEVESKEEKEDETTEVEELEETEVEETEELEESDLEEESNEVEEEKTHIKEDENEDEVDSKDEEEITEEDEEDEDESADDEEEEIEKKEDKKKKELEEKPKRRISTKNYNDTVLELIDEVKMFNDDADDLGLNKRRIWPIILFILVLGGIAVGVYFMFFQDTPLININEKEPSKDEDEPKKDISYRFEETEGGIVFFADNEELVTYECENCEAYSVGRYEYFSTNPTVLAIAQDDKVFLYDYTLEKVVSEEYTQLKNLKQGDETVAFIVSDSEGVFGVIDVRGAVIIPVEYEDIAYSTSGGDVSDYSYAEDIITAKKDGKWGVLNFKGEKIIPFSYEDIYYNGYDAMVANVDGLWYLYDLENNRLIETGYDIIIPIKSYVFASVNNVFYILNYKGESIIEKEIPSYLNTFRSRGTVVTPAFKIKEDGTVVDICIMKDNVNYDEYKFNTVNGELTEIIQ